MYEYSRWDGSQSFTPQSADDVFDQISEYLMQYGSEVLDALDANEQNADVLQKLIEQGHLERDEQGQYRVTPRGLRRIENKALEHLFDVRNKDNIGKHETDQRGGGPTVLDETRPYQFGDPLSNINMHETLRNTIARQRSARPLHVSEDDLVIHETEYQTTCATVVLVDMSGSMTRYGKYGAAKKVAMALGAMVRSRYQGDFFQTVGFYSYASPLTETELLNSAPKPVSMYDPRIKLRINLDRPPSFVPEHFTNIHAGLQFARRVLKRQPARNRQIILITDGEPTAHLEGRDLMLIYPPCEKTANVTLAEAKRCADEGIHVASFALVEDYFYLELVNFVERLAQVTGGVAAYCDAQKLGNLVLDSFRKGRRVRRSM